MSDEFEDELEPFIAEQMKNPAFKAAYEAEVARDSEPAPVASRERVAEVLFAHDHDAAGSARTWLEAGPLKKGAYLDRADALLAAGVFSEPQPECGAVDRSGQRRCVFTPGHHEAENWTSHGDRGGWTWNDQPAED